MLEEEEEPGLGNGGLGRLAACYMDSLATLGVPAIGYGIRYEFGIFDQAIRDGWQVETTDKWLRLGNPWEIPRPERHAYDVKFGGRTEHRRDEHGRDRVRWIPERCVKGVAYDTPVSGFRTPTANLLRLWRAEATESFDFDAFNLGDYYGAVDQKVMSETITKVLYPNDEPEAGKRLRLAQQFFFVSCSLQDMIRLQLATGGRAGGLRVVLGGPVERHASLDCDCRADAAARRRARHGLGRGLDDHRGQLRLHEPHADGRSARAVAGAALPSAPAASPRDCPRDQPAVSRRRAAAGPRR